MDKGVVGLQSAASFRLTPMPTTSAPVLRTRSSEPFHAGAGHHYVVDDHDALAL